MNNLKTDRNTYFDAQGLCYVNKGGWAISYKTVNARQKFFKKYFCGNVIKAIMPNMN